MDNQLVTGFNQKGSSSEESLQSKKEVEVFLEILSVAIDENQAIIENLNNRLGPIMSEETPKEVSGNESEREIASCPLSMEIREKAEAIRRNNNRVYNIISRLEV